MARPCKKVSTPAERTGRGRPWHVMTPTMRFCMLVKEGWKKQAKEDPRTIAREVRAAQREVARERRRIAHILVMYPVEAFREIALVVPGDYEVSIVIHPRAHEVPREARTRRRGSTTRLCEVLV